MLREVRRYCDTITEQLDAGRGMWFTGAGRDRQDDARDADLQDRDGGRPHGRDLLAAAAADAAARDVPRRRRPFSLSQLLDKLCSVDLLHIDDVGAEQTTSWVLEQLYTVVNTRYEDRRSLILTTNLIEEDRRRPAHVPEDEWDDRPDAELRKQIGDRTVSRLYEMCGDPLPMFGDDRRLESQWHLPEPVPAAAAAPDPFDDTRWEDEAPRYGRPLRARRLIPRHGRNRDRGRPVGR